MSVAKPMVALAGAFRRCGRASVNYGSIVTPLQLALLLAWAPTRLLFLALEAAARNVWRADVRLRRRVALAAE